MLMRKGVIASALLHVGVIGATLIAWPRALDLPEDSPPAVPVEVVTVADTSNVAPTVTEEQKTAPAPEQPAEAPPEPEVAPPPPEVAPSPEPKPIEQAKEEAPTPPRAPAVPRPRPQPDKQPSFDIDSVLALLDKRAPKPPPPPADATVSDQTVKGIGAQNAATLDIKDALLAQMRECWNVPVGAPHPEQLIVQVRVFLAPDGKLAQAPQLMPETRAAEASNAYMRPAAEAALRAISVCEPYHGLPADKYDAWREIVMTFDPSKMVSR